MKISRAFSSGRLICAGLALGGSAALSVLPAVAAEPKWPCVQRKVLSLTAAQMWDGPEVEAITTWQDDAEMVRLIKAIISRATTIEQATEALRQWAQAQPEASRDDQLKALFAGVLKITNDERTIVLSGIERFQRRQDEIAKRIEEQGALLAILRERAATDEKAKAELAAAEQRYLWDARFFGERQESLPYACEIPVQIEQRAFDLAREIRLLMKD